MGTEIAVPVFGPLIAGGVAILIYLAMKGRGRPVDDAALLGLGRRRIAQGYLGALVALIAYCYLQTVELSHTKVAGGDVMAVEASESFFWWCLNLFCLMTPFMVLFITALGLPLLAALRRARFASVIGAMFGSQIVAASFTLLTVLIPGDRLCRLHIISCFVLDYPSNALLAGALAAGFVLAARLPWLRSSPMFRRLAANIPTDR